MDGQTLVDKGMQFNICNGSGGYYYSNYNTNFGFSPKLALASWGLSTGLSVVKSYLHENGEEMYFQCEEWPKYI